MENHIENEKQIKVLKNLIAVLYDAKECGLEDIITKHYSSHNILHALLLSAMMAELDFKNSIQ